MSKRSLGSITRSGCTVVPMCVAIGPGSNAPSTTSSLRPCCARLHDSARNSSHGTSRSCSPTLGKATKRTDWIDCMNDLVNEWNEEQEPEASRSQQALRNERRQQVQLQPRAGAEFGVAVVHGLGVAIEADPLHALAAGI